jgi:acyl phosphate:glycerol-3-phosphate acyltransferase
MNIPLLIAGYLLGSIPFAYLLVRRVSGVDLRMAGSGNVGATNVFRTSRRSIAFAAVILDLAKGSAAVLMAQRLGGDESMRAAAGVAAVVGHVYPVWLNFRGGKGVATACGVFGVMAPPATITALAVFFVTVGVTRFVSLGSMIATAIVAPLAYVTHEPAPTVAAAAVAGSLILFRHRRNVARLMTGTERRLGDRS